MEETAVSRGSEHRTNSLTARVLIPGLIAWHFVLEVAVRHRTLLVFCVCAALGAMFAPSHAQASGYSFNFSDITNAWPAIKAFLLFICAIGAFCALLYAIVQGLGQNWGQMIGGIVAALILGFVVANGVGWINGETNQSL